MTSTLTTRAHRPGAPIPGRRWAALALAAWILIGAGLLLSGGPFAGPETAGGEVGDHALSLDDVDRPAIANLDAGLLKAARAAAAAARSDGITFTVTSGWRSRAYQQHLLEEAVHTYGSRAEALRWVSTPDASRHTVGKAIDIGPTDAAYWLARHGADYGLCQVYANEIWHYELRTRPGGRCPELRADGAS